MQPEKRLATEEELKKLEDSLPPRQRGADSPPRAGGEQEEKPEKPKARLGYEHIEHLHRSNKDFERAICRNDFIQKYSQYQNILQFLALFRERQRLSPYDPLPEVELNRYIAEKTPFESWQEFLVAAYEHQATTDEIEALLDRDYQTA